MAQLLDRVHATSVSAAATVTSGGVVYDDNHVNLVSQFLAHLGEFVLNLLLVVRFAVDGLEPGLCQQLR